MQTSTHLPTLPEISLSPATPADAELVLAYMRQLRQDDPMPQHDFANDATVQKALHDLLTNPALGRIWLIRAKNTNVGYLVLSFVHSLEFAGRCGLLDELFIDREHRRTGIGTTALKILEQLTADLGVHAIFLEVSPKNLPASALYRSAGFQQRPYHLLFRCVRPIAAR